jgi:hypothetical protein
MTGRSAAHCAGARTGASSPELRATSMTSPSPARRMPASFARLDLASQPTAPRGPTALELGSHYDKNVSMRAGGAISPTAIPVISSASASASAATVATSAPGPAATNRRTMICAVTLAAVRRPMSNVFEALDPFESPGLLRECAIAATPARISADKSILPFDKTGNRPSLFLPATTRSVVPRTLASCPAVAPAGKSTAIYDATINKFLGLEVHCTSAIPAARSDPEGTRRFRIRWWTVCLPWSAGEGDWPVICAARAARSAAVKVFRSLIAVQPRRRAASKRCAPDT